MRDGLEDWEAKLLDDENQPEFYDVLDVFSLKDNIDKAAKVVVIAYAVLSILNFRTVQGLILGAFPPTDELPRILQNLLLIVIGTGIDIAVIYFPLKALSYVLSILMQMEFNSRKEN